MRSSAAWIAGIVIVLAATILGVSAYFIVLEIIALPTRTLARGADTLVEIARAFRQGSVEIRFSSYAAEISGSQYLQFATLNELEVFERSDSASLLWGRVPLPDIVVEATAPVEYTFYVDLRGEWRFALEDGIIAVSAPPIAFNEPAIDASRIRYRVRQDSLVRDTGEAMAKLRLVLTDLARQRAADSIDLVRETGRRRIEDFVRTWLVSEFPDSERLRIVVVFADEESALEADGESALGLVLRPESP